VYGAFTKVELNARTFPQAMCKGKGGREDRLNGAKHVYIIHVSLCTASMFGELFVSNNQVLMQAEAESHRPFSRSLLHAFL